MRCEAPRQEFTKGSRAPVVGKPRSGGGLSADAFRRNAFSDGRMYSSNERFESYGETKMTRLGSIAG